MIVCPKCKSHAIVKQRINWDWHESSAYAVNVREAYSEEEWKNLERGMRLNVCVLICLSCNHSW